MKILHINKFFDLQGGADVYLHALMEHQRAAGHEVHALSTQSSNNLPSADASRFVERFNMDRSEGPIQDARKAAAFLWNREAKQATEKAIRELRPDIIHLHNIYHQLSSSVLRPIRASKIPCVQTLHDLKLACPNYRMYTENATCQRCKGGKYWNAVKHHCLTPSTAPNILAALEMGMTKLFQSYERTVRFFICPSQFMQDKMVEWGEPGTKMRVVPNPVDLPSERATGDGDYFLTASRLSIEKGIDILIRAAAKRPEIKFRIAGIGPLEAQLKTLAQALKANNVSFLGYVRKPDLIAQRQQARALILSNIGYENASLAALEALAQSLPLIASRIGGLPEQVIPGQTGYLEAIDAMWALDPAARKTLGANGRQLIEDKHGWKSHLKNLEAVYREAGVGRSAAPSL